MPSAHRAQWFSKGLGSFWGRAEELALDLFQWFRSHTCQKEDFANTSEKLEPGGRCVFATCSVPMAYSDTMPGENQKK